MLADPRLDYSLVRIDPEVCRAVPGGHELTATAYAARVGDEKLHRFAEVATETEAYEGWDPADYQRASLRLHRRLRDRLRELRLQAERDAD